jgi:hypothetical protein
MNAELPIGLLAAWMLFQLQDRRKAQGLANSSQFAAVTPVAPSGS